MFGISIDDDPDRPVGTKPLRRAVAMHWNWTTEYTNADIASALGVRERTVRNYLSEPPSDEVQQAMNSVEAEVRMVAVAELKDQLQRAGHKSRTAEAPVKVWPDDGHLNVVDVTDDRGEIKDRYPLPDAFEMGKDGEARYYARSEVREILDQLVGITGAAEPDKQEIEHSGEVDGFNFTISPAAPSDDE